MSVPLGRGRRERRGPRGPQTSDARPARPARRRGEHHAVHLECLDEGDELRVALRQRGRRPADTVAAGPCLVQRNVDMSRSADSPFGMAVDLAHDDLGFIGRADHERVLQIPRPVARERSCNRANDVRRSRVERPEERNLAHGTPGDPTTCSARSEHRAPYRRHLQRRSELVRAVLVGSVAVQVVQAVGVGEQHPQRNAEDEQRQPFDGKLPTAICVPVKPRIARQRRPRGACDEKAGARAHLRPHDRLWIARDRYRDRQRGRRGSRAIGTGRNGNSRKSRQLTSGHPHGTNAAGIRPLARGWVEKRLTRNLAGVRETRQVFTVDDSRAI